MVADGRNGGESRKCAGHIVFGTHEAESEQEMEPSNKASRPTPNDPLPPMRPLLLKVPQATQTEPPVGHLSVQTHELMSECHI